MEEKKVKKIVTIVALVSVALLSLLLVLQGGVDKQALQNAPKDPVYKNLNPLERNLVTVLKSFEVDSKKDLEISLLVESGMKEVRAKLPKGRPIEEAIYALQQCTEKTTYELFDSYLNEKRERAELVFKSHKRNREDIIVRLRRSSNYASYVGDMHIIISDLDKLPAAERIKYLTFQEEGGTLNFALNAWEEQLDTIYSVLAQYNLPVVLNVPMQSSIKSQDIKSRYSILISDTEEMLRKKVDDLLRARGNSVAIASVGGSLILKNSNVTRPFFSLLKENDIKFFDMRNPQDITTTTARDIASSMNLSYFSARKRIQGTTVAEIMKELKSATGSAVNSKRVILWAEASVELMEALVELKPYLENRGIHLSSVKKI